MPRMNHFKTVATDDAIIVFRRIYQHPFFGWQIVTVIPR